LAKALYQRFLDRPKLSTLQRLQALGIFIDGHILQESVILTAHRGSCPLVIKKLGQQEKAGYQYVYECIPREQKWRKKNRKNVKKMTFITFVIKFIHELNPFIQSIIDMGIQNIK
jgi:hypothetical protein